MSGKSVILKPEHRLIMPTEMPPLGKEIVIPNMPMKEALEKGLMHPARGKGNRRLPAVPAGMGVFAKWCIQIIDAKSKKPVYFKHPKTGRMVKKLEAPVHSFNRNFGFFVRGFLQNLDGTLNINETLTDDNGATFLARLKGGVSGNAAAISGLAKIKFGNSSAALVNTQTNLQGTLLGPVTEGTVIVTLVVEDSVQTIFTVTGQVTNGSGGAFSVEEMGLFPELTSAANTLNNTTMMLRDLTGTINVNNGQTIIGTYTFTIAV